MKICNEIINFVICEKVWQSLTYSCSQCCDEPL